MITLKLTDSVGRAYEEKKAKYGTLTDSQYIEILLGKDVVKTSTTIPFINPIGGQS